jgi:4-amino-4-deoxy-L-arabinose transferase-like glycosyltransferase
MTPRRALGPSSVKVALVCITLVAVAHGLFFIWYQRPDWSSQWPDQDGYRRLGAVLAATGKFTRFPEARPFVPEVIRTPAYPLFVAAIYKVAGERQLPVALAQTALFAAICLLVFAIARRIVSDEVALGAAALTALFPPIPYFGALVMTEVWTGFLFTASMWMLFRALESERTLSFAACGVMLALTTLSRPVFVLFPFALAGVGLVLFPLAGLKRRPAPRNWIVLLAAFVIAMVPWLSYNYATIGRLTLSPAGGLGRGLWEGTWQATWPGRLQNELTHLADDIDDRAALDRQVEAVAAREHLPSAPMLEYVHQWEDIRLIWTSPVDPNERAIARITADQEYQRVAMANLRAGSMTHLARRLARGVFVLWAGEIPFRYSEINQMSPKIKYAGWAIQALLFLAACAGAFVLFRRGQVAPSLILSAPILYITAVHFWLLTEARQSLPAQPVLLMLAAFGAASGIAALTGRSLALESQVHKGQHL